MRTKRIAIAGVAALTVSLGTLPDAQAAKKRGQYYGGSTSDGAPFVLELAPGGKAVKRARVMARPDCADGNWAAIYGEMRFVRDLPQFIVQDSHAVVGRKVARSGRFSATGVGGQDYGAATAAVSEKITGRVRGKAASGTLSFDATIVSKETGEQLTTCSTGPLTWTARSRRAEVFAGTTDQDLPAVVELNRQHNMVAHLRFGWGAGCTPSGSVFVPEDFTSFRVAGGTFGDTFTQPFQTDDGGTMTWAYTVAGELTGRNASGDVTAKLTETDAAGSVTATCGERTLTWTARSG